MDKVDTYLNSLPEWQRINLELFRRLIHEIEPSVVEDFKWSVPVFLMNNIRCISQCLRLRIIPSIIS